VKKHSTSNPESSKSTPSSTDIIIKHPMWNREYLSEILLNASMLSHPQKRKFLRLQDTLFMNNLPHTPITTTVKGKIRVLQFNMLADGLSGLRDDLGAFSRIAKEHIDWEHRKNRILHEILQYDPDVITLQECDHFYDWFLPLLTEKGYDGLFAPKPASACLEVSENSDGCAVFARRSKLLVTSVEVRLYHIIKCLYIRVYYHKI
jgi:mRNA deadenylase 3'-5' endonuclease subunit Ccr4